MEKKAVIFDLDGVIVHTDRYHYLAWKAMADRLDLAFDENLNNQLRGVSRMQSLEIILENNGVLLSDIEKDKLAEEKNQLYRQYLIEMTSKDIHQIVLSTLLKLKDEGLKIAIGSSSKNAKLILEQTEIIHLFDAISDGNNITHSKPHPEVFLKAAGYLNLKPPVCLVVEDAIAGIDAGIAGGFQTVAIGDAATYDRANFKIHRIDELLEILF